MRWITSLSFTLVTGASTATDLRAQACPDNPNIAQVSVVGEMRTAFVAKSDARIAGECRYYVEITDDSPELTLLVQGEKAIQEVLLPATEQALRQQTSNPAIYQTTFVTSQSGTQDIPMRVTYQDGDVEVGGIYLVRKPSIQFEASTDGCSASQVCTIKGRPTQIRITGTNLSEIDVSAGVLAGSTKLGLTKYGSEIVMSVNQGLLPAGVRDFTFSTLRPFIGSAGTVTRELRVSSVQVVEVAPNVDEIRFGRFGEVSDTTIYVGESSVMQVRLGTNATLPRASYTVEENVNQRERRVVAVLDVLTNGPGPQDVRLLGVTPTRAPARHNHGSVVSVYSGDEAVFHMHLKVIDVPRVSSWSIFHGGTRYSDGAVHPGERVQIRLIGKSLSEFSPRTPPRYGTVSDIDSDSTRSFMTNIRTLALSVADSVDADSVPLILSSLSTADTVIYVPVAPAQHPRELDFVELSFDSVSRPRTGRRFPFISFRQHVDTATRIVTEIRDELTTNTLHGIRLRFLPDRLDRRELDGVQYLVIGAAIYSADGQKVEEDSARIAVVPTANRKRYRPLSGYTQSPVVRLDDLLDDLGRYSEPGSRVDISIRHDSVRYGGDSGFPLSLRVRNRSPFQLRPYANVMAGVLYFGRRRLENERLLAPNGVGTDSIIRRSYKRRTELAALDMVGALAVEGAKLRYDGRPTPFRIRAGLLVLNSPTSDEKRREVGLSLLYPIQLFTVRGVAAFTISAGGACLSNRECFGLIAPGFDVPLGK